MIYDWNIIGHKKQLEMLESDIESGNLAHAYLLCGPGHVGKYTVAKKLASILQCENNFCGKCPICIQIRKGQHLDTMEFENNREALKIDQIREVIARCNMSSQSKYKIIILQSIGRMTPEAGNALLKTLEEPPEKTVFIMTTSHVREILPTIVSRSRVLKFHLFSTEYLESKLRELYPDSDGEIIQKVAKLSLGRTGQALDLMNHPDMLAYFLKLYKDILYLLDTDNIVERFAYVEEMVEDDKLRRDFLGVMTHVLRSKVLERAGGGGVGAFGACCEMLSKTQDAGILLKQNVNTRLVLENLMLV
ncbi:MAG: AAA family ATPase [Candidatus Gracilibacteria bacterium]